MSLWAVALPDRHQIWLLFSSGFAGLLAYEAFSHGFAPLLLGHSLQPERLVIALSERASGIDPGIPVALAFHYATAVFGYPVAYWMLTRGLMGAHARPDGLRWGLLWGALNAVLIMGVGATLAGQPFMPGLGTIGWLSLAGHMIYGMTSVGVFERRVAHSAATDGAVTPAPMRRSG